MKSTAVIFCSFLLAILIYGAGNEYNSKVRGRFAKEAFLDVFTDEQLSNKSRHELNELVLQPEYFLKLKESLAKHEKEVNVYIYSVWVSQLILLIALTLGCKYVVTKLLLKKL